MSSIGGNFPNNVNSNIRSANRANKRPFNDPENKHDDTELDEKGDYGFESDGEHKAYYDNENIGIEANKRQKIEGSSLESEETKPSELFPPNNLALVATEPPALEILRQSCSDMMQQLEKLIILINEKSSSHDRTGLIESTKEFVAILSRNQIPDQVKPSIAKIAFKLGKFICVEDLKVINEKLFTNCSIELFAKYVDLGITKSNLFQIMPNIPNDRKIIAQWVLLASNYDYMPFFNSVMLALAKESGFNLTTTKDQINTLLSLERVNDPEDKYRKFLILIIAFLAKVNPEILLNEEIVKLLVKYIREPAIQIRLPLWSIPGNLSNLAFNMIFTCKPSLLCQLIEHKIIIVNGDGEAFTAENALRDLVNAALSMISKLPTSKIKGFGIDVLYNLGIYANLYKMTSSSSKEAFKSDYLRLFADKLMEIYHSLTTNDARKYFFYKFNGLINAVMVGLTVRSPFDSLADCCKDFREIYNQCAETILAGGVVTLNPERYINPIDEYYERDISYVAENNPILSGHLLFTTKEGKLVLMPFGYYIKYVCGIPIDTQDENYSFSRIKIILRVDDEWQQIDIRDFNLTEFFKGDLPLLFVYYHTAFSNSIAGTFRAIFQEELATRCELLCHCDGTNYKGFVEINFETGEIGSEQLFNQLSNVIVHNEVPSQHGIYKEQYQLVDGFADNVLEQYKGKFSDISDEILLVMAASVFVRLSCEYMFGTNENRAVLFAEIGKLLIREAVKRYPNSPFPQWKTLTHVWSMLLSNRLPPVVNEAEYDPHLIFFCTEVISKDIYARILVCIGDEQRKYMPPAWSISTVVYNSPFIPVDGGDVLYDVEQNYNDLDNEIEASYDGNEISDDESEISDDESEISDDESEISDDDSEISGDESQV